MHQFFLSTTAFSRLFGMSNFIKPVLSSTYVMKPTHELVQANNNRAIMALGQGPAEWLVEYHEPQTVEASHLSVSAVLFRMLAILYITSVTLAMYCYDMLLSHSDHTHNITPLNARCFPYIARPIRKCVWSLEPHTSSSVSKGSQTKMPLDPIW